MSEHSGATVRSDPPDVDVAVIGAGPAGLMIANLLGLHGLRVTVIEASERLLDYPRGVGMDDETLRTFQNAGLVGEVLRHTVPHQPLAFIDAQGRDLARLAPPQADFGWPRRNGFIQPLADRVLLGGLSRFPEVDVRWSSRVTGLTQDGGGVSLSVTGPDGETTVRASYAVGADGGSSATRKALGLSFDGTTATANWFVIDIRNDPLGRPGAYVCADPRRPYVSIGLPHGIRRFEFMLKPGETEAEAMTSEFVTRLIEPLVPAARLEGGRIDIIRKRVYTHHSRLAASFRSGRVFLIGDAAHVMPVWQGQGYNSGIRDALNLSWKLAMTVRGLAGERILDSYESERRDHARAMIDLSTWVGRAVSVTNPVGAKLRDVFFRSLSAIPRAKSYIVTMRFKPMPQITEGALTRAGSVSSPSPVGRLFIQPTVRTREAASVKLDTVLLDDAIGPWFALIAWNNDPRAILDDDALRRLARSGVRLVAAHPAVQLDWEETGSGEGVLAIGDIDGSLQRWFEGHPESVLLLRPDRIVGGASPAYAASDMVRAFDAAVGAPALDQQSPEKPAATEETPLVTAKESQ